MIVPFGNLAEQYRGNKKRIDQAVHRVLKSGWFILGKEVDSFEKKFSRFNKVKYCVGVASGFEAIQISLMAIGVRRGDEVITTPISAAATALAIIAVGAKPVFVDVDSNTLLIDPEKIEKVITKKTKAILPVHLYGQMCDMKKIMSIANKYSIKVIEDCAQSAGASIKGKRAGSFGQGGAFSFYPTKNLGAFGDAGCIATNSYATAKLLKYLRDYGQVSKYKHQYAGINSRLDEIQAAILSAKLPQLNTWNKRRKQIASRYSQLLVNLPIETPQVPNDNKHVFHLYVIKSRQRDELQAYLNSKNITTQVHFPEVLYQQHGIEKLSRGSCPVAEKSVKQILSLPIYPELKDGQIDYICHQIKTFLITKKNK